MNICTQTIQVRKGQVLDDICLVRIGSPYYPLQHSIIVVYGLHRFVIKRIEAFGLDIMQKIELAYNLKAIQHLSGHYDELPLEIRFENNSLDYMSLCQDHHPARIDAVGHRIYDTHHMPAVHNNAYCRIRDEWEIVTFFVAGAFQHDNIVSEIVNHLSL